MHWRAAIAAAGLAALAAAAPPASGDLVLSAYPLAYTHVTIGTQPALAMIDTGSQIALSISPALARRLNFTGTDSGQRVQGYDFKPIPILVGSLSNVAIGGLTIPAARAAVVGDQVETVGRQVGTNFDLTIGWPALRGLYVVLDYPAKSVRLSTVAVDRPAARIVLPYRERRGSLVVDASHDGKPVSFLFDTGAPGCNVDSSTFGVSSQEQKAFEFVLGGTPVRLLCRGRDLTINKPDGITAVLGEDFISSYAVYFDPAAKTISLI